MNCISPLFHFFLLLLLLLYCAGLSDHFALLLLLPAAMLHYFCRVIFYTCVCLRLKYKYVPRLCAIFIHSPLASCRLPLTTLPVSASLAWPSTLHTLAFFLSLAPPASSSRQSLPFLCISISFCHSLFSALSRRVFSMCLCYAVDVCLFSIPLHMSRQFSVRSSCCCAHAHTRQAHTHT